MRPWIWTWMDLAVAVGGLNPERAVGFAGPVGDGRNRSASLVRSIPRARPACQPQFRDVATTFFRRPSPPIALASPSEWPGR